MKALYPMVGGTATSHKFNLKDPRDLDAAYRLVFNGGWIHSSTGALPNGTTGYANTFFQPRTHLGGDTNAHISKYNRTNDLIGDKIDGTYVDILGVSYFMQQNYTAANGIIGTIIPNTRVSYTQTDARGFFTTIRTSPTSVKVFKNSTQQGSTNTVTNTYIPDSKIYLGARNGNGSVDYYNTYEAAFFSLGNGLTDTEATNFYNSVQKFQTTLGRQIGSPIVSDTDAQAFINAAGLTDLGQANAVNTLVVDLKAAGVWTKMKALYPFVGGTATTHKWNLKDPRDLDAAYRLVFNGGWTHSSTGAKPNGTTGYANTFYGAGENITIGNGYIGYYTNSTTDGFGLRVSNMSSIEFLLYQSSGLIGFQQWPYSNITYTTSYPGLNMGGRFTSGSNQGTKLYKNGTLVSTQYTSFGNIGTGRYFYLAARNTNNYGVDGFSVINFQFTFMSDTLTDTEATAFYTAVQKYQTTLGRQIGTPVLAEGQTAGLLETYSGAAAAYSLRKLRNGYYGNAIRVRRSSDNAEQDIAFKDDGTLDTVSLLAFVGSGNGFVTTWYDQSGNGQHAVQTTASNQPYIVNAGVLYTLNNKPIIRNPNQNIIRCLITPTSSLQARPVSIIASGKLYGLPTNGYGNVAWYLGGQQAIGGGARYEFAVTSSSFSVVRRGVSSAVQVNNGTTINTPFIQQGHFGSNTLTNRFNGVDATTAITDTDQFLLASNFVLIGASSTQTDFMANIGMYEYIFYFTDKVNDRVAIESNINTYYSIY